MKNRNHLMLRAVLFEAEVGNTIKAELDSIRLIYSKVLKCPWLKRGETELDVIAITSKAIYVIEAKNWSQYIDGNYDQFHWTGMGDSPKIMTVFSTYMQNLLHIRLLKSAALREGYKLPPVISIMCVPDSCQVDSDCAEIVHLSEILQRIKRYESVLKDNYDRIEIEKFIRKCR